VKSPILRNFRVRFFLTSFLLATAFVASGPNAAAQKAYGQGVTDTEIKIGNIAPYTGWGSEYAAIARAEAAYFHMINDRGGVNGRKINFVSLDGASESANMLPLARKLVEDEKVLLLFSTIGTEGNLAIRDYLNQAKVPQLFVQSSSAVFNDPAHFPWTMGFFATYDDEGVAYAKYVLANKPTAKIAVLYANDDAGKEYRAGVHAGLGQKSAAMIVKEVSYQVSDASLDTQIAAMKDSGADVFFNFAIGPFATKSIRAAYDLGWRPLQFIPNASLSIAAFLEPAGLEKSAGIICNARSKNWWSARSHDDPAVREFLDWMSKYNPQASLRDQDNVAGYERAQTLVAVLQKCGDNLTRENVMKQAASLDLELGMPRPGIKVRTSPTDYQPIHQLFLIRFDGQQWQGFGGLIGF
jgi:branched-chain amino acid transport system substrate-binding protein